MIRCELRLSCEKRIGTYNEMIPDLKKEDMMNIQLAADDVDEMMKCLPGAIQELINHIEILDANCNFDTDEELKAFRKYYGVNFGNEEKIDK